MEKPSAIIGPATAPKAQPSYIDWPRRVLRQTILVSSIAAEIESNINQTDWGENCYEECRKPLQHEAGRMEDISRDRGEEEIPVLVDLEVQHWMAEALEGAARASEIVRNRIAQIGVRCPSRGGKENLLLLLFKMFIFVNLTSYNIFVRRITVCALMYI